jgi:hypothetical protein
MTLRAGVARVPITPYRGVELTGWGYFIERTWERIRDDLHATALAVEDGERRAAIVGLDLMVIDTRFTERTRRRIAAATGIPAEAVLLACSHSHNAPAAGGLHGVGECDPFYEDWASRQAATAAILAWEGRVEVRARAGGCELGGLTYNRTRAGGPVDPTLTALLLERRDGQPLAAVVDFAAHPCAYTRLVPREVTRDVPGEVCDHIEAALPGATALYLQGACGDVNFLDELATVDRAREPAERIAHAALGALAGAEEVAEAVVASASRIASLPMRRWRREEVEGPLAEARRRRTGEWTEGWREGIGRAMTGRPDDMVARHGGDERKAVRAMARFVIEWGEAALAHLETRPEVLQTEVQALRIGDVVVAANSAELFSSFALALRRRVETARLMVACYANGRIGYVPDEHDIEKRSYAAYQSPKFCGQFPFTAESGPALVEAMARAVEELVAVKG